MAGAREGPLRLVEMWERFGKPSAMLAKEELAHLWKFCLFLTIYFKIISTLQIMMPDVPGSVHICETFRTIVPVIATILPASR